MKYLVVAIHKDLTSFDNMKQFVNDFTIVAETHNEELADKVMEYHNKHNDYYQCEVCSVMEDDDIIKFLNKE